jgi:sugar phosphate isomerase/epimerase
MRLTVSSYSFEAIPLDGTLAVAHAMGFKGVDIAGFHKRGRASLEPDEVGANPEKFADDLKRMLDKYELEAVEYFPQFATTFEERALTLDRSAIEQNFKSMEGIARFCQLVGFRGITVLPGVDQADRALDQNLEVSAKNLSRYAEICGNHGIALGFEAHMGSVADTPERALQILERAPNVNVTLDCSHFVLQYISMERIYKLIPRTGQVHIRPARPGTLQTRYSENAIDFVELINRLKAVDYQGSFSVEFVYADWFGINNVDTLTETMLVKEALEPYLTL